MRFVSDFYRQREPLRCAIRTLAGEPGALALDVGCKGGDVSKRFSQEVGRLIALDRERAPEWSEAQSSISFLQADAGQLPFRSGIFDVLISAECLQYVTDPVATVNEFARVLKPGGKLVISFPEAGPLASGLDPYNVIKAIKRVLNPAAKHPGFVPHLRSRRVLERAAPVWIVRRHLRRGTIVYIYTSWTIDRVQAARRRLMRWAGPGHRIGEALLRTVIRLGFGLMQLDFALGWGPLSYNNVLHLEKKSDA